MRQVQDPVLETILTAHGLTAAGLGLRFDRVASRVLAALRVHAAGTVAARLSGGLAPAVPEVCQSGGGVSLMRTYIHFDAKPHKVSPAMPPTTASKPSPI